MKTITIIRDKVANERRVEDETGMLTEEQKEALKDVDDFHMNDYFELSRITKNIRDIVLKEPVIVKARAIYSNTTNESVARFESIDTAKLEDMYKACKEGRVQYDAKTGEYTITTEQEEDKTDDFLESVFGGKIFSRRVIPTEFYMDNQYSFMQVEFGFRGSVVFVFDSFQKSIFDGWEEVPYRIRNLDNYPVRFKRSLLPFDMCKHGNILRVDGECVIEAECPIQTTLGELTIVGLSKGSKLTARATADMQPAIGTLTHTGMSYGRWSYGRNPLPEKITIEGDLTVELESKESGFTIGRYGENDLPMVYLKGDSTLIAPETKGCRKMKDMIEHYAGSTKLLGHCEYYYE